MADINWKDPPATGPARQNALVGIEATLREHPMRWALLRTYKSRAGAIQAKRQIINRHPEFEFRASKCELYGRYVNGNENKD